MYPCDLHEEFSGLASRSGVVFARRWYWRQAGKTIARVAGAALRVAPWSLTGAALFGFVLRRLGFSLLVALVRMQRPYFNLHSGQVTWDILIARIVEMTLTCIAGFRFVFKSEMLLPVLLDHAIDSGSA